MWPFSSWTAARSVQDVITKKRTERAAAINEALQLVGTASDDQQYILADVATIASKIRNREWKAKRVMEAYIRAAANAHTRTNCLTEILFKSALAEAEALDRQLASNSDSHDDKLLLGVPVSLKDQINVKGFDSSIGFVKYCDTPTQEDALVVMLLRDSGAIPFCKTNVPQTMLAFECQNPLFGRTTNPHSTNHVPGGSSGGEGALLGMSGSPLGIGSDIGGSLRIPAHFSGCYAIKPVFGRFPSHGCRGPVNGYEAVKTTLGPMGRSVGDVELCFRAIATAAMKRRLFATQNNILPLPWRDVERPEKLKIGYYTEDGFIPTSPACARAVNETIEALQSAGHVCIPTDMPSIPEAMEIFQALASADGFKTLTSHILTKEPKEAALFLVTLGPALPGWLRSFLAFLLDRIGENVMAKLVRVSRRKDVAEIYTWQHKRNVYTERLRKQLWEQQQLDAVICPVQAGPAVTHGATKRLSPLAMQTIVWNVADSAVGVIPVTCVDPGKDALPASWSERIRAAGSTLLSKLYYTQVYDAQAQQGLPVGVQIVCPAHEDEKLVEIMKIVDAAVGAAGSFGPSTRSLQERVF